MKSSEIIIALLDSTRRRLSFVRGWTGVTWLAAICSVALGVTALLFRFFAENAPPVWAVAPVKIIFILAALGATAYILLSLRAPNRKRAAVLIEKVKGGLNNDLIVSLDLIESKAVGRNLYSEALAQAHIESSAVRIEGLDVSDVFPRKLFFKSFFIALFAFLVSLVIGAASPAPFKAAMYFLIAPRLTPDSKAVKRQTEKPLVLGDVQISYEYPAYSGKKTLVKNSADGSIEALKGTRVVIKARSLEPIVEAKARFGDSVMPAVVTDNRNIELTITVMKTDSYKIAATGKDGEAYVESAAHPIQVSPDAYPKIDLVEPKDDMEVEEATVLPLKFAAEDDYGLKSVDVVYQLRGKEGRLTAVVPEAGQKQVAGTYNWDVSALGLIPGDRVRYFIEVSDNDTVSGPKKTISRTLSLEIFSPRKEHRRIAEEQRELLQDLVAMLGDTLEQEPEITGNLENAKRIAENMKKITVRIDGLLAAMKKDKLSDYNVYSVIENIGKDVKVLRAKRSKQIAGESISPTTIYSLKSREVSVAEQSVTALDNALGRQKALDVVSAGQEMLDAQRSISELLAKAEKGDKQALQQLNAELERLQMAFQDMMKAMSQGQNAPPEEFLNADAMKNVNMNQTVDSFQGLRNAIKDGDLKTALETARNLQDSMAKMMASLQGGMREFGQNAMGESLKQLNEATDKIQELRAEQRRIYEESQHIGAQNQEKLIQNQKEKMDKLLNELRRLLTELNATTKQASETGRRMNSIKNPPSPNDFFRAVGDMNSRLSYLENASQYPFKLLDEKDLYGLKMEMLRWRGEIEAIGSLANIVESIGKLGKIGGAKLSDQADHMEKIINEILKLLDETQQPTDRKITDEDRKRLESLGNQQQQLQQEAEELKKKLDSIRQKLSMLGEEPSQKLEEAAAAMNQSGKKLGASDPQGSLPHQAQALKKLDEAAGNLQGLQQQLKKSGAGSMPIPMPMSAPMSGSGSGQNGSGSEGDQEGGYQAPGKFYPGKVEIPGREGYKAPEAFREEILRAMRNKSPESYRELNRDYYRKLIE